MAEGDFEYSGDTVFHSLEDVESSKKLRVFFRWIVGIFLLVVACMFLPWTQNVPTDGQVATLQPIQQFHTINSVIAGKIKKWYVIEGQHVQEGDTIAQISEIKDDYFDPELLTRTEEQLAAKESKVSAYKDGLQFYDKQLAAIAGERSLKLQQSEGKIGQSIQKLASDSANLVMALNGFEIGEIRLKRADSLLELGFKSRKEWESQSKEFQEAKSKLVSAENKVTIAQNEWQIARMEYNRVENEYSTKLAKTRGEQSKLQTDYQQSIGEVAKLKNQLENYRVRVGLRYILASQDAYITQILIKGVGNIAKEGQAICTIMPAEVDVSVELYVKPIDLPLIKIGEKIMIFFDGWPAFAFSGWPGVSTGTFGGEVYAVDKVISQNGKYRVLVIPDPLEPNWPEAVRVGGGARGLFLLNDVSIGYEIWRQINGFPPDFYEGSKSKYKLDKDVDKKYHTK